MKDKSSTRFAELKYKLPEETRQHLKRSHEEFRQAIDNLLPEGFVAHRRNARKELLLAMRSMLDSVLKQMEKTDL